MSGRSILITGCNGGIGRALQSVFKTARWRVIGLDQGPAPADLEAAAYVQADLADCVRRPEALEESRARVLEACQETPLCGIINNAAVQHVGPVADLEYDHIRETFDVNALAPFFLAKAFLELLKNNRGVVLNIGSVHAQATKPGFSAYAASKAALHGVTRALAVDLGPDVRVLALAPAAVATPMLTAGFEGHEEALEALEGAHPAGRIASPEEIAKVALFLTQDECSFLTGMVVYADGGVLSRLHDPV